jgi:DNA-binding transcriptional MerR regulator
MTKRIDQFTETTNTVARAVDPPCDPGTVRDYANLGLIEYRRLANGVRLFKPSAVKKVREIRAKRLARRGGRHSAPSAA